MNQSSELAPHRIPKRGFPLVLLDEGKSPAPAISACSLIVHKSESTDRPKFARDFPLRLVHHFRARQPAEAALCRPRATAGRTAAAPSQLARPGRPQKKKTTREV